MLGCERLGALENFGKVQPHGGFGSFHIPPQDGTEHVVMLGDQGRDG